MQGQRIADAPVLSFAFPPCRRSGYDVGMAQLSIRRKTPKQNPRGCATRILLLTPPLLQPNTPYPATAVLAGHLQAHGFRAVQTDLSLALLLRLFSADGLRQVEAAIRRSRSSARRTPATRHFLRHAGTYAQTVDAVVAFLQGHDDTVAARILAGGWLVEGPRFRQMRREWQHTGVTQSPRHCVASAPDYDLPKHLASLYLDDLADAIRDGVDPRFGFARYAEHLAVIATRFDPLLRALEARPSLVDRMLDEVTADALAEHKPALVGLTVPFPGTLYGALCIARRIRQLRPRTRIALGGGYVNTELRELDDPRVFDFVDHICFDDGEEPLLRIAQAIAGTRVPLVRTLVRRGGRVVRCGFAHEEAAPGVRVQGSVFRVQGEIQHPTSNTQQPTSKGEPSNRPTVQPSDRPPGLSIPDYAGLPLDRYISLAESTNPMHRIWSEGRWLKLQLAHGCYWHRCRFCDTALDYIGRYVPPRADAVVARMLELQRRTGLDGFHFTDEALSPALLRQVSERLVACKARVTWWGNIRFERAFTPELAGLLARAGCVAVTGGLECAHDRLLAQMDKGITLRGAALACRAFARAGVLVHAYLMYGFPTQTVQETVDGLEYVRQLFAAGVVQSAYWHRFALTCHSPIAAAPEAFGLRVKWPRRTPGRVFARNELRYEVVEATQPGRHPARSSCSKGAVRGSAADVQQQLGAGLRRATYNYMLGLGLDEPVAAWFDGEVPDPTRRPDFMSR